MWSWRATAVALPLFSEVVLQISAGFSVRKSSVPDQ
ncbi:unannotated protein [freshwater metagenome]|uniref:Unannotated protein n=1 Tax=freshwater metagenome TaxID=449393 RepID=A0A6J6HZW2_9ZZZZ